ncbi:MAG: hypothetical protein IPL46_21290 [Saprospiraceae bacterium]|nr:hypothetical protein [Saprospiraceae bacterium]
MELDIPVVVHNECHGATEGSIQISPLTGTAPFSYVITSGPTINVTGASTGLFTDLATGSYDIMVTDASGCTKEILGITVDEPPSDAVNIVVASSTPTGTFFLTDGVQHEIIYTLTEIGGSSATSAEIRIPKAVAGEYALTFDANAPMTNNADYDVDDNDEFYLKLVLKDGLEIPCSGQSKVSIRMTRQTVNESNFPLTTIVVSVAQEANNLDNGVVSNIIFD